MSGLVSIITPTYNHERYIAECIDSVLAQTYANWEMIIIDDGSTDRTAEIVSWYDDPRIRYVHQDNAGIDHLAQTYNRALAAARGEMIAILEGDDYWPADKLAIQAPDFDDTKVVLSSGMSAVDLGDGSEKKLIPAQMPPEDAQTNRPIGRAAKHMVTYGSLTYTFPVSTMMRTETLRQIGGFQQPPYLSVADFPTFLRLTLEGEFRFHREVLGIWRRHRSSVTLSRMPQILDGAYRYAFEFLQQYRERLPISDEELDLIETKWDEVQAMNCILRGRMWSKEGRKDLAAISFRQACEYRINRKSRLAARLASMLSAIRLPVEPIYKLTRRVPLAEATTIDTGDRIVQVGDSPHGIYIGRWRAVNKN